jgi:hypothetical protein
LCAAPPWVLGGRRRLRSRRRSSESGRVGCVGSGVGAAAPGAGEMALYYLRGFREAIRPVKGLKCEIFEEPIVQGKCLAA